MLTRNNKMTTNNNKGVNKRNSKHQGHQFAYEISLFVQQGTSRCRGLKALDMMLEDTKNYIGDVMGIRSNKISCFIYFLIQGSLGNMVGNTLGGTLDRPQKFAFETMKGTKKDILNVINVNVLIGENQISHLLRAYSHCHYRT